MPILTQSTWWTASAAPGRPGADRIRRLLAFSRRQALEPVTFNLAELVRSMMRLLTETLGAQIAIDVDIAPDLWSGFTDPHRLKQRSLTWPSIRAMLCHAAASSLS